MPGKKRSWQSILTPSVVILIGVISIFMLIGFDRIGERKHASSMLIDVLMDLQIATAAYHIGIDDILDGDNTTEPVEIIAELNRTINSLEATLKDRGNSKKVSVALPLQDPAVRTRLEELLSLMTDLRTKGIVLISDHEEKLGSKSDREFHAVSEEIRRKSFATKVILVQKRHEYRNKTDILLVTLLGAWAMVMAVAVSGLWRLEMRRKNAEESLLTAHEQLLAQTDELTEHRRNLTKLVERRTSELTDANRQLLTEVAERRQTEAALRESDQQIRNLSNRLLIAQEEERRRISMELHDALGQALNVTKLKLRLIEKGLLTEQIVLREDCEQLLGYMDQVIEEVRRLSLALSPTILEDLGLTQAIEWLVSNFARIQNLRITHEIEKVDHLIPESKRITIYRVVQEALSNIGKHAKAGSASVTIRRLEDEVVFTITDDGKGFDPEQSSLKDVAEKGLGLSTMNERVRMMGGTLDLWSCVGQGTRLTFLIPADKSEG